MRPLFNHQTQMLQSIQTLNQAALFCQMRLGKTAVAIRWAISRPHPNNRILVLAPLTVLSSWQTELEAEGIPQNYVTLLSEFRVKPTQPTPGHSLWVLGNYEQIRAHPTFLTDPQWHTLILDESTRIRNPKAQITKLLTSSSLNVPNRLILSGLPAPESPMDYCEQFRFLGGSFLGFPNYWMARANLFRKGYTDWDWLPKADTLERIKFYVHSHAFVLTRKQAGIGSQKVYEVRSIPMTPPQKTAYQKAEREFAKDILTPGGVVETTTNWEIVKLLWMARIAGGFSDEKDPTTYSNAKVHELLTLLEGELKNEPVVVWFRFNREIKEVADALSKEGFKHRCILGLTTRNARYKAQQWFKLGNSRILLCQVKCAKFGIDLSTASTAIYYSNSYDYEDRAQSEDRIVHPAKKEPLLYLDLVTQNTVDEDVVAALRDKSVSAKQVMNRIVEGVSQRRKNETFN